MQLVDTIVCFDSFNKKRLTDKIFSPMDIIYY